MFNPNKKQRDKKLKEEFYTLLTNLDKNATDSMPLCGIELDKDKVKKIIKALKNNSKLKFVIFDAVTIDIASLNFLLEALVRFKTLQIIHIKAMQLDDNFAEDLAKKLGNWPDLTELNLADNTISDMGAVSIIQNLKAHRRLEFLGFHTNQLGDMSASACAELLGPQTKLEKLVLTHNQITTKGIKNLATALRENKTLSELCIGENQLATPLRKNKTLSELCTGENQRDETAGDILCRMLESNQAIIKLDIYGSGLTSKEELELETQTSYNRQLREDRIKAFVQANNSAGKIAKQRIEEDLARLSYQNLEQRKQNKPEPWELLLTETLAKINAIYGTPTKKNVFVSYAWGNSHHEEWVTRLVYHLQLLKFEIPFDINNGPGKKPLSFYLDNLDTVDAIVVVGTKALLDKYNWQPNNPGEVQPVVREELRRISEIVVEGHTHKVFPILLEGEPKDSLPPALKGLIRIVNFREDYVSGLCKLVRSLYDIEGTNEDYNNLIKELEAKILKLDMRQDKGHTRIAHKYDLLNKLNQDEIQELLKQKGIQTKVEAGQRKAKLILGEGEFGKLRLARSILTGEMLGVKKIKGKEKIALSLKEAELQQQLLDKPNIMPLWDSIETRDSNSEPVLYQFMPLAGFGDGRILQARLVAAITSVRDKVLAHIAYGLLNGLRHMHDLHIYHSDIKPDNFVLDNSGEVYWIDFGCAVKSDTSHLTLARGDRRYFSPECFPEINQKGYFDATKAAAWALGVTLLEIMNNKYPFDSNLAREVQIKGAAYFQKKLSSILLLQQSDANPLIGIIKKLLEIDVDQRLSIEEAFEQLSALNLVLSSADQKAIFKELKETKATKIEPVVESISVYSTTEVEPKENSTSNVAATGMVPKTPISNEKQPIISNSPFILMNSSKAKKQDRPGLSFFRLEIQRYLKENLVFSVQEEAIFIKLGSEANSKLLAQSVLEGLKDCFSFIRQAFTIQHIELTKPNMNCLELRLNNQQHLEALKEELLYLHIKPEETITTPQFKI